MWLKEIFARAGDRTALIAFKSGARFFNLLPVATACRLGAKLGHIWLFFDRRHQRIVEKNLKLALGLLPNSSEMRRMLHAVAGHLGCNLAETLLLYANGPGGKLLRRNMRVNGLERLRQEVEKGKGVIIVSAHFGNWEMAGLVTDRLEHEVVTVGKPIKGKPQLYREIAATRAQSGFTLLSKSGSAGMLARRLKKGGVIALLVDQRVRKKYRIFADFFGHQVPTSPAPAMLARLSGSPIIPVFTRRRSLLHHEISIGDPFFVPTAGNSRQIIADYTKRINRIIEKQIRACPEQWFWPHDRWRRIETDNEKISSD